MFYRFFYDGIMLRLIYLFVRRQYSAVAIIVLLQYCNTTILFK